MTLASRRALGAVALLTLLCILLPRVVQKSTRRWWRGVAETLRAMILAAFERRLSARQRRLREGSTSAPSVPPNGLELQSAPVLGGVQTVAERIAAPDGETCVVWWSSAVRKPLLRDPDDDPEIVWVLLPGGMTSGDKFYMHNCIVSGVLGSRRWVVFHNPGIVNACVGRSPAALTETTYVEHFVRTVLPRRGVVPAVMGFSAGSMLALALARRFHESPRPGRLCCVVAIHGPDRIRDVFERLRSSALRLDVAFALSLWRTMVRSGCTRFLPRKRGGGLHERRLAWLRGWEWMQAYTEEVFGREWSEMEEELWSCRRALSEPLSVPCMRVLSRDDPIVAYDDIDIARSFAALDEVVVQSAGGHCAAFRSDAKLARRIRRWVERWVSSIK